MATAQPDCLSRYSNSDHIRASTSNNILIINDADNPRFPLNSLLFLCDWIRFCLDSFEVLLVKEKGRCPDRVFFCEPDFIALEKRRIEQRGSLMSNLSF